MKIDIRAYLKTIQIVDMLVYLLLSENRIPLINFMANPTFSFANSFILRGIDRSNIKEYFNPDEKMVIMPNQFGLDNFDFDDAYGAQKEHMCSKDLKEFMIENNLDITRVVGHHFYSAKNCPQPMLENDLEIWYEFRELVRTENKLITAFEDYELTMELESAYKNVNSYGRVTGLVGNNPQLITYTVTIKNTKTNISDEEMMVLKIYKNI